MSSIPTIDKIANQFEFGKVIGHGSLGIVRIAKKFDKKDRKSYAVKSIKKESVGEDIALFQKELEKITNLKHAHILSAFELFQDLRYSHIVYEECTGGSLIDHIIAEQYIPEDKACKLSRQILMALNHMHQQQFIHRDLRPENIMFKNTSKTEIKIIDFGLAAKFGQD